ncbi:uracil-DNA glycosylase family protein [Sphingobacterium bovistauri]|uniref:Uracil-DNA glycosylase-like domain-containing protein n=1 Tax=Sphingobacterium bovistauri TaxID=2781959 RepID=A0ABS7Z9F1_9SPHI|nr:uracil-DNA glycosylase family protein [Sphingobacterium bovistauri]MCA5006810.1 hypothetical protein [Sphingobacterium bovistauri]
MNTQLQNIYNEKWNTFSIKLNEILQDDLKENKPTNPLLLFINEEKYQNADIKIMIFGQETNDWAGNFQNDINISINTYDEFYNSNACYSYGKQFWNGFNRFLTLLNKKFPNKKIEAIWNNVIKVGNSGRDKNYPPEYIYNIEKEYFNIINDEINILNPDIILFMSGPNYDNEIRNSLKNIQFEHFSQNFSERQIAKLNYHNFKNIYRTYHPNYLWRNNINSYFSEIINDIKL